MEDEEDTVAAPQERTQQPQRQTQGSPYDGLIAENANGHRVVYRSNASGRGRWVEVSPANADAESRRILEGERGNLTRLRQTSQYAEEFIGHNRRSSTGGIGQEPWVPTVGAPHRQAMRGLSAQMVRANIQPGQASTMNSDAEQQMTMRTYPADTNSGEINAEIAVRTLANRDLQIELVTQMEDWLTKNTSLNGFQAHWQSIEPRLRDEFRRQHAQNFGRSGIRFTNLNERGQYDVPDAPAARAAPSSQGSAQPRIRVVRDPQTGELRRAP